MLGRIDSFDVSTCACTAARHSRYRALTHHSFCDESLSFAKKNTLYSNSVTSVAPVLNLLCLCLNCLPPAAVNMPSATGADWEKYKKNFEDDEIPEKKITPLTDEYAPIVCCAPRLIG